MSKTATRTSYGKRLLELVREHPDIVVLDADLASSVQTNIVKQEYPEQFIECGIAEANMMGTAAGLAVMGLVPFTGSFAMFSAGRAYEQVRNSIGYPHLNVKIGASHAGISTGEDGASHQCCEDIALMRTIPGMVVLSPADDIEARACVTAAYEHQGPVYMRFSKYAVEAVHDENYRFEIGKGEVLKEGSDLAVISTGILTSECLKAAEELEQEGKHVRVINICSIKPIDEALIIQAAKECGKIITVEEHSVIGGLGEAVCGTVCEAYPVPVHRIGIQDVYGHSGKGSVLLDEFGLTAEHLKQEFEKFL
ncbi:MAG: transketolase family protein [Solobacterium sp.]|nr:transketolase family protein [Solobacterium sp.]